MHNQFVLPVLTQWYVMILLNQNVLLDFHVVNTFQNRKPMSNAHNSHLLQFIMLECYQGFSNNLIFYASGRVSIWKSLRDGFQGSIALTEKVITIL